MNNLTLDFTLERHFPIVRQKNTLDWWKIDEPQFANECQRLQNVVHPFFEHRCHLSTSSQLLVSCSAACALDRPHNTGMLIFLNKNASVLSSLSLQNTIYAIE